jgi:hypothetical protein
VQLLVDHPSEVDLAAFVTLPPSRTELAAEAYSIPFLVK